VLFEPLDYAKAGPSSSSSPIDCTPLSLSICPLQATDQFRTGREGTEDANVDQQTLAMFRNQVCVCVGGAHNQGAGCGEVGGGLNHWIPSTRRAWLLYMCVHLRSATISAQALKLMGSDEQDREFGGEVSLESTVYWWHEKYKPRKPKYFNRVHTGEL